MNVPFPRTNIHSMNIAELKQLRLRLGVKQSAVAEAAGVSRFVVSLGENGHIDLRLEELLAIARFLASELEQVKALILPMLF